MSAVFSDSNHKIKALAVLCTDFGLGLTLSESAEYQLRAFKLGICNALLVNLDAVAEIFSVLELPGRGVSGFFTQSQQDIRATHLHSGSLYGFEEGVGIGLTGTHLTLVGIQVYGVVMVFAQV